MKDSRLTGWQKEKRVWNEKGNLLKRIDSIAVASQGGHWAGGGLIRGYTFFKIRENRANIH